MLTQRSAELNNRKREVLQLLAARRDRIYTGLLSRRFEVQLHHFHAIMIGVILPPFYPVLDTALLTRVGLSVEDAAEAILEAGARILQLRHKAFFSRDVFESAERVAAMCRTARTLFVVNDRADIARLLDAGLHLGQHDIAPADARKLAPVPSIIGFSTHNEEQLRNGDTEPVDHLAIGPIFATTSKENPDPVLGVERLRSLRGLTRKPVVAIGGIRRETAAAVLDAGADSVAIIGDLLPERCTKEALRARTEEWLAICSSRTSHRP